MRLLSCAIARPRLPRGVFSPSAVARRRCLTNNGFFRVSEEVREALNSKKPVVALETTIYTHGFPYPDNVALASLLESIVRVNGGVPATIGILDGVARVGLDPEELIRLTASAGQATTLKLSRRDLAYVCGLRLAGKKFNGGTTIAGTMLLAELAGIKIFGTGGLGGVHRGAESSMDISADLRELGRTPVTVVSSGCKSFLDIPRTLEYLETEGVYVGTFADGRKGNVDFPAFWSRDSGVKSPTTVENEIEAAAMIHAQRSLNIASGMLFANPVPEEAAILKETMDSIIEEALRQADASGVTGKDNTPFVLAKVKELSEGKSIPANRALIESNVRRATIVARELAVLEAKQDETEGSSSFNPILSGPASAAHEHLTDAHLSPSTSPATPPSSMVSSRPEIIVAGALAVDFSCDYAPFANSSAPTDPVRHTSNPAIISQTLGGVSHNIAKAAHLLGAAVQLHSVVADDLSGSAALTQLQAEGMSTNGIEVLPQPSRTAQYVAINNVNKDLTLAMADMQILETIPYTTITSMLQKVKVSPPKILVLDANWDPDTLHEYLTIGRSSPWTTTIFEPVSTAKALRIYPTTPDHNTSHPFPHPIADIITPNELELTALHDHAYGLGFFDHPVWFATIDALGIPPSGLRIPLAVTTTPAIVDAGIPQKAIKLLPFFPTILTKLGPQGVLLTQLLKADDPILSSADEAQYVLSRCKNGDHHVGGLYVRFFPAEKVLKDEEVVSVNGIGDTLVGALATGLARGQRVQYVVPLAQKAATLSLGSKESVSPELKSLRGVIE
ncbi:hypothetical protein K458DRAFT_414952 [Lentithecium fluviatile CBS 122367]|uniref:Carbohydrate kinase PfkB domain-containing protein n=1 Tax=Lentithecium fluviatile CBS 122367 TaxID=1168545 RepID=A0A6G1JBH6_9PLEO|nr:hypothetical protein K458DRAFT_414952 [Lentithecium fluviatile CBS 122367]